MKDSMTRSNGRSWALLSLVAVLMCAAVTAEAAWKPVSPAGDLDRVRVIVVTGADNESPERGIWTVLDPGQEMRFTLTGRGPVRLETRPEFGSEIESDAYRLLVALPDTVRRLKRHAPWENNVRYQAAHSANPSASQSIVGLGETDQWQLDWQSVQGDLVVTNRIENQRRILCRVLLGEGVAKYKKPGAPKKSKPLVQSFGFEAALPQIGWDSNAFVAAKDAPAAEKEAQWFLPVDLEFNFEKDFNVRTAWQAKYTFEGSFYSDPVLDERRHRVHLGGESHLGSLKRRQGVDFFYGYRFTDKNDTYNGRGDREEFETTDPVTNQPVPLGNRFDYQEHRLVGGLSKDLGRRSEAKATVSGLSKDYKHDYAAYSDIYSLDQDHLEFELEFVFRPRRDVKLGARGTYLAKDYVEKFSRDLTGAEVIETPTSLHNTSLILGGDFGRGEGLRSHAEVKFFSSSDQYAGYWDYSGYAVEGGGGWRWAEGHKIDASLRYSSKDYDNSHVDHDPALPLRVKSVLNFRLTGEYVLNENWEGIARLHYKDAENNNAAFAYTRTEIIFGLSYRR